MSTRPQGAITALRQRCELVTGTKHCRKCNYHQPTTDPDAGYRKMANGQKAFTCGVCMRAMRQREH